MKPQIIVFSLGPIYYFPDGRFIKFLLEKNYIFYILPSAVLVATIYNFSLASTGSAVADAIFAAVFGLLYFSLVMFFVKLHQWISRVWLAPGYTPIAYFGSALVSEYIWMAALRQIWTMDAISFDSIILLATLVTSIAVALEQIFIRFYRVGSIEDHEISRVMTRCFSEAMTGAVLLKSKDDTEEISGILDEIVLDNKISSREFSSNAVSVINIGLTTFQADKLMILEAEGHYLKVTSTNGIFFVKERISAACMRIPEDFGMRVHRSFWVAFREVKSVVNLAPGKYGIETQRLGTIPLSRNLKDEFVSRHDDWCKVSFGSRC